MPEQPVGFYVYIHKVAGQVVYVGKGSSYRAIQRHRNRRWIELYLTGAMSVELIQNNLTEDAAFHIEHTLIEEYRRLGYPLVNCKPGGTGGRSKNYKCRKSAAECRRQEKRWYLNSKRYRQVCIRRWEAEAASDLTNRWRTLRLACQRWSYGDKYAENESYRTIFAFAIYEKYHHESLRAYHHRRNKCDASPKLSVS